MNTASACKQPRSFQRLAWFAVLMTAFTIGFGAFVRLSDAGLSCPDWPTCYGKITWPQYETQAKQHVAFNIRPLQTHKVWREQVHRFLAGLLGIEVLILALLAVPRRRDIVIIIVACGLIISAVIFYINQYYIVAGSLALLAEISLLWIMWHAPQPLSKAAILALMIIIFQALLGMWTVTWLLKPIVVMGHLLGAMVLFAVLTWIAWQTTDAPIILIDAARLRHLLGVGLMLLVMQLSLGGWVSANYAGLACGGNQASLNNFPQCVSQWWPQQNYRAGFTLWRGIGVDYEGGVLDSAARIAIHIAHRIGAVVVAVYLLTLGFILGRIPGMRGKAWALKIGVIVQISLGILIIKLGLPLIVAVAHNIGATILLFIMVSLLARLRLPEVVATSYVRG